MLCFEDSKKCAFQRDASIHFAPCAIFCMTCAIYVLTDIEHKTKGCFYCTIGLIYSIASCKQHFLQQVDMISFDIEHPVIIYEETLRSNEFKHCKSDKLRQG